MIPEGLLVLACWTAHATAKSQDYTPHVNLFLGTQDGGNMFPGVVAEPYAMVKLGPDVEDGETDAYSGYLPEGKVWGFSMMHESGTGGAPKYGIVNQMPVKGNVSNPLLDLGTERSANDSAEVGYYKSELESGITIEVAATAHAGMYRYTFPAGENAVVVDVSHVLPSFRGLGWGQGYAGGSFELTENGYKGSGIYNNGWNIAPDYTVYFCGHFDQPIVSRKTFTGEKETLDSYGEATSTNGTCRQGGVFTFNKKKVISRVGISFISTEKACANVKSEIPKGTKLQHLVEKAQEKWNVDIFRKFTTTEANDTTLTQLYSYLYGMHLLPSNRTGENPGWTSDEPYYDDFFTLWDLFRCSTALWQVVQPKAYEEIIRGLIEIWRHEGWLPDARSSNFNGATQGGSNADIVLADAYVKGVRGAVDWQDGYAAVKKDAEVTPPNNEDPRAPDSSTKQGRGALPDWKEIGWISPNFSRAVSRAVEYAVDDFGVSQIAAGLEMDGDAAKYLNRSRQWRNHWNPEQESLGFSGFVVPRFAEAAGFANDSFVDPYDPLQCGGCYWSDPYYEDPPWSYSLNAHHDMDHLIELSGGQERFVERLEKFFEPGVNEDNTDHGETLYDVANEPAFTSPYLFNFVDRQDLSVKYSRRAALTYFGADASGLPGNSDAGAMQTWILWSMIGLYPITGQTTFLIGSPWLDQLEIDLGDGKLLKVTGGKKDSGYYVQSLKVNGEEWDRAWLTWDDVFAHGGTMEFVLGDEQVRWANGTLPPSPASV